MTTEGRTWFLRQPVNGPRMGDAGYLLSSHLPATRLVERIEAGMALFLRGSSPSFPCLLITPLHTPSAEVAAVVTWLLNHRERYASVALCLAIDEAVVPYITFRGHLTDNMTGRTL